MQEDPNENLKNLFISQEMKNENIQSLADAIPQIVWTATPDGSLDFFNERWYQYSGFDRSLRGDEAWIQIVHPDDLERVGEVWKNSLETGKTYEIEFRFLNPKVPNTFRWFLVRAIPIYDKDGAIFKWFGTSTDIHDYKMFEKQKDDFLAMTSHELKTPLTAMKLQAEVLERLLKKDNNEQGIHHTQKLKRQVDRLAGLVNELVEVTKIQNGQLILKKELFSLEGLLQDILEDFRYGTSTHEINFEMIEDSIIFGDMNRISQVIINLVSNAVKYSPDGEKVEVTLDKDDNNCARICIKDYGIGIAEEHIPMLFDQFFRAIDSTKVDFDGLGLGLFIANDIVKKSGGNMIVESKLGEGSTFGFTLPSYK